MNVVTRINPTPSDIKSVTFVNKAQELSAIRDISCAAVIWRRDPMPHLNSWLNILEPSQLPAARLIVQADRVAQVVHQICDSCETPATTQRDALANDIANLAMHFAALMDVRYLRLRLDVVKTNACRKFHIDAVTARLVCTYRGQTTQFGEADAGHIPDDIQSVPHACPVILRGTKWPKDVDTRLRHRSPPIEGTGETRLVLVLDPIYNPTEDV